ncbi:hypothetical protein MHK_006528 [Candidatus Magnetomorum sp. HK-1]|nr:hypothetical protein MHK_006528 [Candidatus Magnetomorum sp. HK-1]
MDKIIYCEIIEDDEFIDEKRIIRNNRIVFEYKNYSFKINIKESKDYYNIETILTVNSNGNSETEDNIMHGQVLGTQTFKIAPIALSFEEEYSDFKKDNVQETHENVNEILLNSNNKNQDDIDDDSDLKKFNDQETNENENENEILPESNDDNQDNIDSKTETYNNPPNIWPELKKQLKENWNKGLALFFIVLIIYLLIIPSSTVSKNEYPKHSKDNANDVRNEYHKKILEELQRLVNEIDKMPCKEFNDSNHRIFIEDYIIELEETGVHAGMEKERKKFNNKKNKC